MRKLTICVPTYNRKKCVCELVHSIINSNLLSQLDLLIIDDGSSDGTYNALKEIIYPENANVRIEYQENKGFVYTAASFFSKCQTDYLMLADDDMIITEKIPDLINFLDRIKPDFVSPIWHGDDGISIFRGKKSEEKMNIEDFHLATDHGPGLVYRIAPTQPIVSELMVQIKSGCQVTELFFLGVILLYLFLEGDNFWWCSITTCGFRKTGAEPSNIRDMYGRNYKFIISIWERHRSWNPFYESLIKRTSSQSKKITYQKLLTKENLTIYQQFRMGLSVETPELLKFFDGGSVFYDIRHFYSRVKSFIFYAKVRWFGKNEKLLS